MRNQFSDIVTQLFFQANVITMFNVGVAAMTKVHDEDVWLANDNDRQWIDVNNWGGKWKQGEAKKW